MTSHWIRWKAYLEIIQRKKLRYQNIFHHTLKPKIFIFTIKWKNFFLRLNETLLLIWNSFLNDSFPHFRKMQVFWYDTKLLKKCNRKKERCNQRVKKNFFCTPGKVTQRDIFRFGSEGRPWSGGRWSVTFWPRMFSLMNNFHFKKSSIKMCMVPKMACRKYFK